MAKSTARQAFGPSANAFMHSNGVLHDCAWRGCTDGQSIGPVCTRHAVVIASAVNDVFAFSDGDQSESPQHQRQSYVYYLMVGPETVKIGTTASLTQRMTQLRTDVQYVVALERGGREHERERHRQFATERIGRREDFRLSQSLRSHIDGLRDQRDALVNEAINLNTA